MCCAGGGEGEGHPATDCGSDLGVFPELGGCLWRGVTLLPGVGALARRAAVPIAPAQPRAPLPHVGSWI